MKMTGRFSPKKNQVFQDQGITINETIEYIMDMETYVMDAHRLVFGEMNQEVNMRGKPALLIRIEEKSGWVVGYLKHTDQQRLGQLRGIEPNGKYTLYVREVRIRIANKKIL